MIQEAVNTIGTLECLYHTEDFVKITPENELPILDNIITVQLTHPEFYMHRPADHNVDVSMLVLGKEGDSVDTSAEPRLRGSALSHVTPAVAPAARSHHIQTADTIRPSVLYSPFRYRLASRLSQQLRYNNPSKKKEQRDQPLWLTPELISHSLPKTSSLHCSNIPP
jgi:hypothetical protein